MATTTASAFKLNAISSARIAEGAFKISHAGAAAGAKVSLCLEDGDNRLDITDGYGQAKLAGLLDLVEKIDGWGRTVKSWTVQEQGGVFVSESAPQDFTCPVKPYEGAFTFDDIWTATPALTYPGNGKGRTLTQINGKWYFRNGSVLETDNAMRGFDCTTFPMALFNCYPDMTGKYGTALAVALHAEQCNMEMKKEAEIKAFFAAPAQSAGIFFMWSEGHVVLVKNGTIHEFTYGGYRRTPVDSWGGYYHKLWWIRKLPASLTA